MMRNAPMLVADRWHINDHVVLRLPSVGEILAFGEEAYFSAVYSLYVTPYECMAQLAEQGIDYEQLTDFQLFWFGFLGLRPESAAMLFDGLDPAAFALGRDPESGLETLISRDGTICIDASVAEEIASVFRRISFIKRCEKKAGNSAAKKFLLERARKKLRSQRARPYAPFLENAAVKLACAPEFGGGLRELCQMNLYAFNACLHQVQKRCDYDHICNGIYAGTVDTKKIDLQKIHWLSDS